MVHTSGGSVQTRSRNEERRQLGEALPRGKGMRGEGVEKRTTAVYYVPALRLRRDIGLLSVCHYCRRERLGAGATGLFGETRDAISQLLP